MDPISHTGHLWYVLLTMGALNKYYEQNHPDGQLMNIPGLYNDTNTFLKLKRQTMNKVKVTSFALENLCRQLLSCLLNTLHHHFYNLPW